MRPVGPRAAISQTLAKRTARTLPPLVSNPAGCRFRTLDTIDPKNLVFNSGTNVATIDNYTAATGLLQLHSGTAKATLLFENATLGSGSFHLAADTGAGTVLTRS